MVFRNGMMLVVATTLVLARGAHADDPDGDATRAKEISVRARALADQGFNDDDRAKLEQAIRLYKEAFTVDPNPLYQCNAGVAYKLIDDLPRAHALLTQCLRRLPAVQARAVAPFRAQLDEIEAALPERHVAVDVITAPQGATLAVSTLADDERLVAPAVVWLPSGTHSIAASANGYQRATEEVLVAAVDIVNHTKKRVRLSLVEEVRAPAVASVVGGEVEGARPARSSGRRTAGKVSLGAGVALLAGGGVMHAVAYQTRQELDDGIPQGDAYDAKVRTLETQRGVTIGLYALGGAALVTGAVLFYLAPKHADRVAIAPAPGGGGAMVWFDLAR